VRAILQRVSRAEVRVEGHTIGAIGRGLVVLLGVGREDSEADADFLLDRIRGIRVFADDAGKMNLALGTVGGELLVISRYMPIPASAVLHLPRPGHRTRRDGSTNTSSRGLKTVVLKLRPASSAPIWTLN